MPVSLKGDYDGSDQHTLKMRKCNEETFLMGDDMSFVTLMIAAFVFIGEGFGDAFLEFLKDVQAMFGSG